MKSSTLHRSNLSSEKMAVLAELRAHKTNSGDSTPGVYRRPSKQKELDILWQSFKINQKEEKSPGIYLLTGFIAGALCMFLMTAVMSIGSSNVDPLTTDTVQSPKVEKKLMKKNKASKIAIVPADKPVATSVKSITETYTVQGGDTLESIVIRFYGKYDPSKVNKIVSVNNMKSAHSLSIGQKLTIPLN